MDPFTLINKYYTEGSPLYDILVTHSRRVAEKAVAIARLHPEFNADETFLYEAAMLHDIGIYLTHAPDIECFGTRPYICHGTLGSELLKTRGCPAMRWCAKDILVPGSRSTTSFGRTCPFPTATCCR